MDSSHLERIEFSRVDTLLLSSARTHVFPPASASLPCCPRQRCKRVRNESTALRGQGEGIRNSKEFLKNLFCFSCTHINEMLKASNGDFCQEIMSYLSSSISLMNLVFLSQYFDWHFKISSLGSALNCNWNNLCGMLCHLKVKIDTWKIIGISNWKIIGLKRRKLW